MHRRPFDGRHLVFVLVRYSVYVRNIISRSFEVAIGHEFVYSKLKCSGIYFNVECISSFHRQRVPCAIFK